MEIRDLTIFLAVARHGSISRAAEALNYVQSNITARIKILEEELGVRLFHRQSKGVTLTPSGHLLHRYAQQITQLEKEARTTVGQGKNPQGRLAIASMETTAAVRLPPLLAQYHQRFPEVDLQLITGPSESSLKRLLTYEVDAALVAGEIDHDLLIAEEAFSEELVLVAPQGYQATPPLAGGTILVFRSGCSYRMQLERWLRDTGRIPYRIMEFGSIEGILGCVAAGMGISFLPRSVAEPLTDRGFTTIGIPAEYGMMTTWLVRRKSEHPGAALEAFRTTILSGAAPADEKEVILPTWFTPG